MGQVIQFPKQPAQPIAAPLAWAIPGQALTLRQPHRRFGTCYAEFVGAAGDGRHVLVRKLISSMYRIRWTKPLPVARGDVLQVHDAMARPAEG